MPDLSDIVQQSISASSATPQVPGFGLPLVLAQNVPAGFTNRYREYSDESGAISDGFDANHPAVIALQVGFSQSPRPPLIGVGRRALKTTQSVKFTCGSNTAGDVYSLNVIVDGVATPVTYTVPSSGSPTTSTVATAIAALMNVISGVASSASSAIITNTASAGAGTLIRYTDWQVNNALSTNFILFDNSSDPGIATDLNAIRAENSSWYGLTVDSCSKAEITAAAAWAEANNVLCAQQSSDSAIVDSTSTTDIACVLQNAAYSRTGILTNLNDTQAFAGLAWQCKRFAGSPTPGNDTWCYNTLAGVTIDFLNETQFATLGAKSATGYVNIDGVNMTAAGGVQTEKSGGKAGSGEFFDTLRFLDWVGANIQVGIFIGVTNGGTGLKTPMTDKGGAKLGGINQGVLVRGENAGGFVPGSSETNVPTVASMSPTDRANRIFSGITWTSDLAGAAHLAVVSGVVNN